VDGYPHRITHVISDRPKVIRKRTDVEYIQPQWVFDCFNFGTLLPCPEYFVGESCPPHLSPFVKYEDGDYIPERMKEILKCVREYRLRKSIGSSEDGTSGDGRLLGILLSGEGEGVDDVEVEDEENVLELGEELQRKRNEGLRRERKAARKEEEEKEEEEEEEEDEEEEEEVRLKREQEEKARKIKEKKEKKEKEEAEELKKRFMMLPKKKQRAYKRLKKAVDKKDTQKSRLVEKRKKLTKKISEGIKEIFSENSEVDFFGDLLAQHSKSVEIDSEVSSLIAGEISRQFSLVYENLRSLQLLAAESFSMLSYIDEENDILSICSDPSEAATAVSSSFLPISYDLTHTHIDGTPVNLENCVIRPPAKSSLHSGMTIGTKAKGVEYADFSESGQYFLSPDSLFSSVNVPSSLTEKLTSFLEFDEEDDAKSMIQYGIDGSELSHQPRPILRARVVHAGTDAEIFAPALRSLTVGSEHDVPLSDQVLYSGISSNEFALAVSGGLPRAIVIILDLCLNDELSAYLSLDSNEDIASSMISILHEQIYIVLSQLTEFDYMFIYPTCIKSTEITDFEDNTFIKGDISEKDGLFLYSGFSSTQIKEELEGFFSTISISSLMTPSMSELHSIRTEAIDISVSMLSAALNSSVMSSDLTKRLNASRDGSSYGSTDESIIKYYDIHHPVPRLEVGSSLFLVYMSFGVNFTPHTLEVFRNKFSDSAITPLVYLTKISTSSNELSGLDRSERVMRELVCSFDGILETMDIVFYTEELQNTDQNSEDLSILEVARSHRQLALFSKRLKQLFYAHTLRSVGGSMENIPISIAHTENVDTSKSIISIGLPFSSEGVLGGCVFLDIDMNHCNRSGFDWTRWANSSSARPGLFIDSFFPSYSMVFDITRTLAVMERTGNDGDTCATLDISSFSLLHTDNPFAPNLLYHPVLLDENTVIDGNSIPPIDYIEPLDETAFSTSVLSYPLLHNVKDGYVHLDKLSSPAFGVHEIFSVDVTYNWHVLTESGLLVVMLFIDDTLLEYDDILSCSETSEGSTYPTEPEDAICLDTDLFSSESFDYTDIEFLTDSYGLFSYLPNSTRSLWDSFKFDTDITFQNEERAINTSFYHVGTHIPVKLFSEKLLRKMCVSVNEDVYSGKLVTENCDYSILSLYDWYELNSQLFGYSTPSDEDDYYFDQRIVNENLIFQAYDDRIVTEFSDSYKSSQDTDSLPYLSSIITTMVVSSSGFSIYFPMHSRSPSVDVSRRAYCRDALSTPDLFSMTYPLKNLSSGLIFLSLSKSLNSVDSNVPQGVVTIFVEASVGFDDKSDIVSNIDTIYDLCVITIHGDIFFPLEYKQDEMISMLDDGDVSKMFLGLIFLSLSKSLNSVDSNVPQGVVTIFVEASVGFDDKSDIVSNIDTIYDLCVITIHGDIFFPLEYKQDEMISMLDDGDVSKMFLSELHPMLFESLIDADIMNRREIYDFQSGYLEESYLIDESMLTSSISVDMSDESEVIRYARVDLSSCGSLTTEKSNLVDPSEDLSYGLIVAEMPAGQSYALIIWVDNVVDTDLVEIEDLCSVSSLASELLFDISIGRTPIYSAAESSVSLVSDLEDSISPSYYVMRDNVFSVIKECDILEYMTIQGFVVSLSLLVLSCIAIITVMIMCCVLS
ncbi:Pescadillo like protein, partial [Aduncisulcus paluster]